MSKDTTSSSVSPLMQLDSPSQHDLTTTIDKSTPPEGWPTTPSTLQPSWAGVITHTLVDILFLALSLLFLIFGLIVRHYDGAPVADHTSLTQALMDAARYGPTIFPILYTAVVGRAIKGLLSWRLECGQSLGTLDLLAGSTTLVNTLTTLLSMRLLNITGPLLLVVWTLSPIGGQASLRVMSVSNSTVQSTQPLQYLSFNQSFGALGTGDNANELAIVDDLFVAALLGPYEQRQSSEDPWGNVKIPMIEHLEAANASDAEGWFVVPHEIQLHYSSLLGIPVAGLDGRRGNISFNVESFYWTLNCFVLTAGSQPPNTNTTLWPGVRGSASQLISQRTWSLNQSYYIAEATLGRVPWPSTISNRTLYYNTWDDSQDQSGSACNISTTYVESSVLCSGASCAVANIRRSRLPHPPQEFTLLDDLNIDSWVFQRFASIFANIITGHPSTPTAMQAYIADPEHPFLSANDGKRIQLSSMDRQS